MIIIFFFNHCGVISKFSKAHLAGPDQKVLPFKSSKK